jgi:NADH dehydrogenase/NADH:ubiquinone oxidoreductase subunit G
MQKKVFETQKEKMKICYDFFGKYEGSRQSTNWERSFWFDLHYVEPPKQYDPRKQSVIKPLNIPKDWIRKMRFGRPDDVYIGMDPNRKEEVRKNLKGYEIQKKEWESYVDAQWNTAFDDAFGVSEFQAFLATIPEKINVDLETTPADKVITSWFDLYEQTRYFLSKISMDHVHCEGIQYNETVEHLKYPEKKGEIDEWKKKPEIVQQLYKKVQDLLDDVEILSKLTEDGWMPNIITYADGTSANMYTRYDPIRRITIERAEPPVKMKRTSKSTPQKDKAPAGGTKTTVKKKK